MSCHFFPYRWRLLSFYKYLKSDAYIGHLLDYGVAPKGITISIVDLVGVLGTRRYCYTIFVSSLADPGFNSRQDGILLPDYIW